MKSIFLSKLGIQFHRGTPGWYYLAFGKCQPFKFLQHGGWICLSLPWFKRFLFDVPKQRGWRWD